LNCKLKTLYDHENLYCIESIIIVNQIKVFKLNSLTNRGGHTSRLDYIKRFVALQGQSRIQQIYLSYLQQYLLQYLLFNSRRGLCGNSYFEADVLLDKSQISPEEGTITHKTRLSQMYYTGNIN
jgi:hypothetical protein